MLTVNPWILALAIAFGLWAAWDDLRHQWLNRDKN